MLELELVASIRFWGVPLGLIGGSLELVIFSFVFSSFSIFELLFSLFKKLMVIRRRREIVLLCPEKRLS